MHNIEKSIITFLTLIWVSFLGFGFEVGGG